MHSENNNNLIETIRKVIEKIIKSSRIIVELGTFRNYRPISTYIRHAFKSFGENCCKSDMALFRN